MLPFRDNDLVMDMGKGWGGGTGALVPQDSLFGKSQKGTLHADIIHPVNVSPFN